MIEYRMKVHVFGNMPSPAVATHGLRKTIQDEDADVKDNVFKNFYVDDGLISLSISEKAISVLKRTQNVLKTAKDRLHDIVSNNFEVMESFPSEDLEKNLMSLDIGSGDLPAQQSLCLAWNINSDSFNCRIRFPVNPSQREDFFVLSIS